MTRYAPLSTKEGGGRRKLVAGRDSVSITGSRVLELGLESRVSGTPAARVQRPRVLQ